MSPIALTLPLPPSSNSHWRHVTIRGQGRVLLSVDGRKYRAAVQAAVAMQVPNHSALGGPLGLTIRVYMARRGCDIDNRVKPLLDALTHAGLWADDVQVCSLCVSRYLDADDPRVEVVVRGESGSALLDAWRKAA